MGQNMKIGSCLQITILTLTFARVTFQQTSFDWYSTKIPESGNEIPDVLFEEDFANLKRQPQTRATQFEDGPPYDFIFPSNRLTENNNRSPNENRGWIFSGQTASLPPPSTTSPIRFPNLGREIPTPPTRPNSNQDTPPSDNNSENMRRACESTCLTTNQYDPVCGDDAQTYFNEGRLNCAQRCGKNVQMRYRKPCSVS